MISSNWKIGHFSQIAKCNTGGVTSLTNARWGNAKISRFPFFHQFRCQSYSHSLRNVSWFANEPLLSTFHMRRCIKSTALHKDQLNGFCNVIVDYFCNSKKAFFQPMWHSGQCLAIWGHAKKVAFLSIGQSNNFFGTEDPSIKFQFEKERLTFEASF